MLKVEAGFHKKKKGHIAMRLLDEKGKAVAAAVFPLTLFDEMGAALMMSREKLEADGILKPEPGKASDYSKAVKW
ncbi:MAG: hypothetical protein ACOZFS_05950 [Thermodesulfobacteriota bacterium]